MEVVKLVAQRRTRAGKGVARQLRREGMLPAVLYGRGESVAVSVALKDLAHIQQSGAGGNTILDFEVQGGDPEVCNAIVRDVQMDALTQTLLHADFYRLDMNQPIAITVPLEFVNAPEDRLKAANASWRPLVREIDVQCLPRDIPAHISVDLEALEVGVTLRARDIALPGGVTLTMDPEEAIVTAAVIAAEVVEEVEAAAIEGEEAAEAEAEPAE